MLMLLTAPASVVPTTSAPVNSDNYVYSNYCRIFVNQFYSTRHLPKRKEFRFLPGTGIAL
ncbi:hypothetical protein [Pseudodesulfovibrio portus]|uniref:hypothetical protein n=1 Tax=Pseudodesulfovibrio portus TaxID=231439 RepID=UPI002231001F|nr:hypothetical protein [Pseudodesulfovibrio portus]